MSLHESPVWKSLVLTGASPGSLIDDLAATSGPAELDELIRFIEKGSDQERDVAILISVGLRFAFRDDQGRFEPTQKKRLSIVLLQIARNYYPHHPLGVRSLLVLRFLDNSLAGHLLSSMTPNEHWDRMVIDTFLQDARFAVENWEQLFREFSRAGGYLGEKAVYHLESAGYISEDELNRLGQHFRRHKDAKTLNRIHSAFISHQVNKPIKPIVDLLGAPNHRRGSAYIYEVEGVQLYMEHDKDGRLTGIKLK